ncbi:3-beta hydroxysteroid dehydrogenase [Lujinxingia litoralis]|uniref:3-beta hydroxysteroid dehydrogenase n=1 Tax=Lujinxingia litoralis TaxID=2211119 RepID=A0A328CBG1_9DELT|nr:NAD-dependent epimerase/dehydratase family protein [Lujinxingia litoralis]RAL23829.1 3-beta hydroxysteroid dehydrogenase [Lujinxingia litoralis]
MKVLVTGGGGFLGEAIVDQLLERGDQVRSLARGDYPHLREKGVEVVRGDLSDAAAVSRAVQGCEEVYHVAAKAGVWGPYQAYYQANVVGTENILQACREHRVARLIYTSTPSVVYGEGALEGVDESVPYPTRYLTAYPETKARAEQAVLAATSETLQTVALRPHLIWGPGDNHLVPRIIDRARRGKLKRVGDGRALVDSVYVDDAARAHLLAAQALATHGRPAGKAYFITQDEPMAVGALIDKILVSGGLEPLTAEVPAKVAYAVGWVLETGYRLLGKREEPLMTRFLAKQLSTAHYFDISAAKQDFDYHPQRTIDEGMEALGAWIREAGI